MGVRRISMKSTNFDCACEVQYNSRQCERAKCLFAHNRLSCANRQALGQKRGYMRCAWVRQDVKLRRTELGFLRFAGEVQVVDDNDFFYSKDIEWGYVSYV